LLHIQDIYVTRLGYVGEELIITFRNLREIL